MLLDNVVGGHPANGWCTYSPESDRWFEIDLGASYAIDSIKIHSIREGTEGPELANNLTAFISANSMRDSNGNAIAHADLVVGANDAYKVGTTSAVSSSNPFETLHTQQPATLASIDLAIANLNTYRSTLGASQNRLEYAADNLTNIAQNTQAARSRILDTDYASESTELARTQILQQAGTAMLAQANTQAQIVTSLLP